jgi:predicted enzyme related to lactoylglutathione lyase
MDPSAINSVIHLELHTGDLEGAVAFYAQLFGWTSERIRVGAASYVAMGMGNRLGGGVVECPVAGPSLWLPYVEVRDVARTTERATGLGGELLLGPREGPEGWRSVVSTPTGGEVAFWQPRGNSS